MNVRHLTGWGLLVLAFLGAAFESAARVRFDVDVGFALTSQELLSAYRPDFLRAVQEWIEITLHWALWDPVLITILRLPAWALLGIPGVVMVMCYRPARGNVEDIDEDQFFMFDRLAKRAHEEGYHEDDDDDYTIHNVKENYDPAGLTAPDSIDAYVDKWEAPRPHDSSDVPGKI